MKIHECAQGSEEWIQLRAGVVTASEFDDILTPEFEPRQGRKGGLSEMTQTYLHKKIAERILGRALLETGGFGAMEQGTIREEEAIPWYEMEHRTTVSRVGFITTDDGRVGCSPDGMQEEPLHKPNFPPDFEKWTEKERDEWFKGTARADYISATLNWSGLEVKCPDPHTHVGYLIDGVLPKKYATQVHGSIYVTGAPFWMFLSYRPKFPALVVRVERDEKICEKIGNALGEFLVQLDEGVAKIKGK